VLDTLLRHDGCGIVLIRAPLRCCSRCSAADRVGTLDRPHTFFADPFLITAGGTTYCFFFG
jgi:hypothetical protein